MRTSAWTAALIAALAVATGCGSTADNESGDTASTTTAAKPKPKRTPLACLDRAGLMDPEKRDANLWRGTDPIDGTLVIVTRVESASEAHAQAADATAVVARTKGRYVITGALKTASGGWHHKANVANVADCLPGSS